jgi:hypothetical protein
MDGEDEASLSQLGLINRIINQVFEPTGAFFTPAELALFASLRSGKIDYGGVTGTILPGSIFALLRVMTLKCKLNYCPCSFIALFATSAFIFCYSVSRSHHTRKNDSLSAKNKAALKHIPEIFRFVAGESVFCDIGSGSGRPTMYAAQCLKGQSSFGFDICSLQVDFSMRALDVVQGGKKTTKNGGLLQEENITFFQGDVFLMASLGPATHCYSFFGDKMVALHTAALLARSESVKFFSCVYTHEDFIELCGLIHSDDVDVIKQPGCNMRNGSYMGAAFPWTQTRRERVLACLAALEAGAFTLIVV